MPDDIRYVCKRAVLKTAKEKTQATDGNFFSLKPGDILKDTDLSSKGITQERFRELVRCGALVQCTESTLVQTITNKQYKAPAALGDHREEVQASDKFLKSLDDALAHKSNPNEVRGYDPKLLAQKSNPELLAMVQQAMPNIPADQLQAISQSRNQMQDILSQHHTESSKAPTPEDPLVPKT